MFSNSFKRSLKWLILASQYLSLNLSSTILSLNSVEKACIGLLNLLACVIPNCPCVLTLATNLHTCLSDIPKELLASLPVLIPSMTD
jgi:hypothetical protein